ncbi:MAG: PAS domain S-box protein [Phycisphaerae bacterium]|nr:PAS domain S-box protein [Saprospiraceae bacterium]
MNTNSNKQNPSFLAGGGEMGELIRSKDWNKTPLGSPDTWPQSLRTTLSIILNSKFPMFLFWGEELICFYNDAYRPSLGNDGKHPSILGGRGEDHWQEIWHIIKPLIDQVLAGGEATWSEDQLIPIYRNGKIEDVYWTFSYSPVQDESGKPTGVFVTCTETTERKKGEEDRKLVEKALQESEQRFRNIVQQAPLGITILQGPDYEVEMANETLLQIVGKEAGAFVGKPLFASMPEVREIADPLLSGVLKTGIPFYATDFPATIHRFAKEELAYFNLVFHPLKDEDELISGIIVVATEATESVKAKISLTESEQRFRHLVMQSPIPMAIFRGPDYVIEMTNKVMLENIWRKKEADIKGKKILDVFPELLQQKYPNLLQKVYTTGTSHVEIESLTYIQGDDGLRKFYLDYECSALLEDDDTISGLMVTVNDVTEKVEARLKVEESEKRFRTIANSAPVLIWMSGTDKLCIFFNKAWVEFTGRGIEQGMGNDWATGIHPEDLNRCLEEYTTAFDKREEFLIEYRLKRQDGAYRWVSDKGVPRFTIDGLFEGYIGACMDIHERVVYQKKLKEDEERLNIVIEASELGTWEINLMTNEVQYSDRYLKILGYKDRIELTHAQLLKHLHPDDFAIREEAFKQAYATGILNYISRIIWTDGSIHWFEGKGKVFYNEENKPVKLLGTTRDITEEKNIQQRLQEREQKFRLLAQTLPHFVWTGDADGILNFFNQSVNIYSGLTKEQINNGGWLQIVHPDEREENIKAWQYALTTGSDFHFEHRFRRYDGTYRWQMSRAVPQKDADGNIKMWVGTSTDIQDQKMFTQELEKQVQERTLLLQESNQKLEESIMDLQKMNAELQSFAYISSHDLQEPLRKIQTFVGRILDKEYQNLSDTGKDYFQRMQSAAQRMQTLIEDLLAYSRTNTTDRIFKKIDLQDIIEDVKNEFNESILAKNAFVEIGQMCDLYIIPFQFRQLIHNLMGNSLKFSKPGIPPHIKIECVKVQGEKVDIKGISPEKEYSHLSFTDNGIGFEPQYKNRIFEVFQQLHGKSEYKGTGIGLAIVKKIVENHNGIITATGELGKGARFDIYIPVL